MLQVGEKVYIKEGNHEGKSGIVMDHWGGWVYLRLVGEPINFDIRVMERAIVKPVNDRKSRRK